MEDDAFDHALIAAWFALAADADRRFPSVAAAAREADLPLEQARVRFASRASVLMRFGRMADQAALAGLPSDVPVRDALFDMIMRRLDAFQTHRAGMLAVLRLLPGTPPLVLLLGVATERSMRWLLDAAGVPTSGLAGKVRVRGLVAVWLWTLRAWQRDESADLSTTMAALDRALGQAERVAGWLGGSRAVAPPASQPIPDAPPETPPDAPASDQPGLEPNEI